MIKRKLKDPNPNTCKKCPRRFDPEGCEKWMDKDQGIIETNVQTGEQRIMEGCFYEISIRCMIHVIAAANQSAASSDSMKNSVVNAVSRLNQLKEARNLEAY